MDKFIVVHCDDAIEKGYPDTMGSLESAKRWGDSFWCLYETDGEKPINMVADDHGEPEDQLLVRDWKWVPRLLNVMAAEIDRLKEELCAAKK